MIAVFLRGEINSPRFNEPILKQLTHDQRSRQVIDEPDLKNLADNTYRRNLLAEHRGYGPNDDVFFGFPDNVHWKRATLSKVDLRRVKYLNYDYWVELSGGTRLVLEAAKNVRAGKEVFGVSNSGFLAIADAVRPGATLLEPILVSVDNTDLVLIDGHARMTGYMLAEESCPDRIPVLVGFSDGFNQWDQNDFS